MINIIKSVLFDCGYEDVVQTEIEFEKLEYKIDIFKMNILEVRFLSFYRL